MTTLREVVLNKMAGGVTYTPLKVLLAILRDEETREYGWTSDIMAMLEALAKEGAIIRLRDRSEGIYLMREYVRYSYLDKDIMRCSTLVYVK